MNRRLLVCLVSLVPGRVRGDLQEIEAAIDEVEAALGDEYFRGAPFDRVGLTIRYSDRTALSPRYERLRRGELPASVEVEMGRVRKLRGEELRRAFRLILLETLIRIGGQYKLNYGSLQEARRESEALNEDVLALVSEDGRAG